MSLSEELIKHINVLFDLLCQCPQRFPALEKEYLAVITPFLAVNPDITESRAFFLKHFFSIDLVQASQTTLDKTQCQQRISDTFAIHARGSQEQ